MTKIACPRCIPPGIPGCRVCGGSGVVEGRVEEVSLDALDFNTLRAANVARCEAVFHPLHAWSPTDWSNAMAGEAGEACNVTKKMLRGDPLGKLDIALAKELADVVIYADLLAARMNINLGEAVRLKFNEVSDRRKCDIKL